MKLHKEKLPNHEVIDQEVRLWKVRYDVVPAHERPTSLASSIKECDEGRFPNLLLLLKIGCTLLVISCECERSFSTLKRLKEWLRYSMINSKGQHWLKWIFIIARKLIIRRWSENFYHYMQENITVVIWFLVWMCVELYLLKSFPLGAQVCLEPIHHLRWSSLWH